MPSAVIGALRVSLGLDSAEFTNGAKRAQASLSGLQKTFASVGSRLQGFGTALSAGVTLPFAAMAKGAVEGALAQRQAMAQVEAALNSMGPVAGRTSEQLAKFADQLEMRSLADADEILKKVTANFLTFGNISGTVFDRAQQAAVDLAQRMGGDLQGAAMMLGKALNDPTKGLAALARVGIQFTAQQREQIKAMQAAGNTAGAQAIMLAELERQFGGAAAAAANTDPWRQAQVALGQAGDAIGEALLPVIPPVTDAIVSLAQAFADLSPETQKFVVIGAGIAAAMGPAAIAIGSLMTGVSGLVPLLAGGAGLAGGATAAGGALAGLTPILGPLAVAVGGVYLAFKHWDEIKPWIDGVVQRTTAAAVDINARLATIQGAADGFDQRMGVPSKTEFIDAFMRRAREAAQSINSALASVQNAAAAFDASVARAFTASVGYAQQLHAGVKTWLVDRLGGAFTWVKDRAKDVGDAFHQLYDRVVGHSYVPDMVDGIADHFGRLGAVMVNPALEAVGTVNGAMASLSVPSLEDPGAGLRGAAASPFSGWSKPLEESARDMDSLATRILNDVLPAAEKTKMSFGGWLQQIGQTGNALGSLFGMIFGEKAGNTIGQIIGAAAQIGGALSGAPSFGSFDSMPGFAAGGSIKIGGRRGIDQNVLAINGAPIARVGFGETLRIDPANDRGRQPVNINVTAQEGALFRPVVRAEAAGQAVRVTSQTQRNAARRQRQRLV